MRETIPIRRGTEHPVARAVLAISLLVIVGTVLFAWQDSMRLPSIGDRMAALSAEQPVAPQGLASSNGAQAGDEALLLRLGAPARVRIEALRIDAPITPVGLVDGNVLQVPKDIQKVGWYEYGPKPGSSSGSSVLVAHRDGTTQGRGVFFALDALDLDSMVEVVTSTGVTLRYRVVAVEGIRKSQFEADIEEFFATDGPPRLTLITCGGAYDRSEGGYQANVVVTAVPVA